MKYISITVIPRIKGKQLVRFSQPFPEGFLKERNSIIANDGDNDYVTALRIITKYPGKEFVRCAVITFMYEFVSVDPVKFTLIPNEKSPNQEEHYNFPVRFEVDSNNVVIYHEGSKTLNAVLAAPPIKEAVIPDIEIVEENSFFIWKNYYFDDEFFPRTIEIRASIDGTATVNCHIQRKMDRDAFAPELGWDFDIGNAFISPIDNNMYGYPKKRLFKDGADYEVLFSSNNKDYKLYFPLAGSQCKGYVELKYANDNCASTVSYRRAAPGDMVPMQSQSFRRCAFSIAYRDMPRISNTLAWDIMVENDIEIWKCLYPEMEVNADIRSNNLVAEITGVIKNYAKLMSIKGDDFGNITGYDQETQKNDRLGMNSFHHVNEYFYMGFADNDHELVKSAIAYSYNFNDLAIWWGEHKYGSTRHPNIFHVENQKRGQFPYLNTDFAWRGNEAGNSFYHKGFSNFFIAYEQTGDPVLLKALNTQIDYAMKYVNVESNCTRNVGVIRDFALLYSWTGAPEYLEKAIKMFEDYKKFINDDGLFSENGELVKYDEPFINDDNAGNRHAYAKPYILCYAIRGLTALYKIRPHINGLKKAITDVGVFVAQAQDECGTFRYPHPMSGKAILWIEPVSLLADILNSLTNIDDNIKAILLRSIENTLRAFIAVYDKTGKIGIGVTAWEVASGRSCIENMHRLYDKPSDRDRDRDFVEGGIICESLTPESILRWQYTLNTYAKYNDINNLTAPVQKGSQLDKFLILSDNAFNKNPGFEYQKTGIIRAGNTHCFPAFYIKLKKDIKFDLARCNNLNIPYEEWKQKARSKVIESYMLQPQKADFEPTIIDEEDRGSYTANKVVINITEYSRINTYLLVPKGRGPFPAILLLHDHGAKFDIGKEKVIRPFNVPSEVLESSAKWIEDYYGGRYIGDELAKKGYVCFAADMLNWSERGLTGYSNQHVLDANMQFLGSSFSGHIMNEDLNAADFLTSLPFVDKSRIGAMGLSVGAYRTWHVSAISDNISAGAAICWLSTIKWQMAPGINLAGGQANTMLHPGLYNHLDIPDVASIACPKPMLFFNGYQDGLFPIPSVREAYSILKDVWAEQKVQDRLYTKLWDVPHLFNEEMQEDAFSWMDKWLKPNEEINTKRTGGNAYASEMVENRLGTSKYNADKARV